MKAIKYLLWTLGVVLVVGFGLCCFNGWRLYGDELRAMRSFEQLDDSLFTYTFRGDYGFKQFLEQGGAKTDIEMAQYVNSFLSKGHINLPEGDEVVFDAGCSTIQYPNLFCRSFDFGDKGQQMVIVRTFPKDGYASLSTSSFAFMGLGDRWKPVSAVERMAALATVFIPFDGINEKGLCVAELIELDGDTTDYDTDNPDLTIVGAIRLILDYAASVDEAIALLNRYDIHKSIGWQHHLSIADSHRSVVVEWKAGQMHVTDTPLVTNHCLWEHRDVPIVAESKRRMTRLTDLYESSQALPILQEAAYDEWTIWSIIFNRDELNGTWFIRHQWDKPHTLSINQ